MTADIKKDEHLFNYVLGMGQVQGTYYIDQELHKSFPSVIQVRDVGFDPYQWAYNTKTDCTFSTVLHNEWIAVNEHPLIKEPNISIPKQYWMNVGENSVLCIDWGTGPRYWLAGPRRENLYELFHTILNWKSRPLNTVMVFEEGVWQSDEKLYRDVQKADRTNLILEHNMLDEIYGDIGRFFKNKDVYDSVNVTWKRGLIFAGPPGCGKTQCIRTLINELEYPCLYVKSFEQARTPDAYSMSAIFSMARKVSPCILILEDLDTFGVGKTRSTFLNELDGFEQNTGVLIIGTTNYPEKLDAAISKRPSRFDRTYWFQKPELEGRIAYLNRWNERIGGKLKNVQKVAEKTDGYSFAALQELGLSALVISVESKKRFDTIMIEQIAQLKESDYNPEEKTGAVHFSDNVEDDEWDNIIDSYAIAATSNKSGFVVGG